MPAKRWKPLSPTMWRVLHNVHFHDNPMYKVSGMSAHGGAASALYALCRRGLVTDGTRGMPWKATPAGIAVLCEKKPPSP